MTTHRPAAANLLALLAAVLALCLPAIWNGQPLLYPDTPTYVRGAEMGFSRLADSSPARPWLPQSAPSAPSAEASPGAAGSAPDARRAKGLTSVEDKVVLAGRSVYYGVLVYAGYLTSDLWLAVVLQALAVAYPLHLLMVRLWGLRQRVFVASVAVLGLLTPLGAYTGFLMPDVFAPVALLSIAALAVYWRQLRPPDRWALGLLLAYALSVHASHLAVAVLLLMLLLAARLLASRARALSLAGILVVAGCCAAALAAEWTFNKAVTAAVGAPPLRLPHPMARLIDMGPGTDYLKERCPAAGYAACAFVRNYPTQWTDFLFSTDPAKGAFALADPDTRRRLSDEQLGFVLAVVREHPGRVAASIALDVLHQLSHFGMDIWDYGTNLPGLYVGRVPESVLADMQDSWAGQKTSAINTLLTRTTYAAVIASLVFWGLWRWRGPGLRATGAPVLPPGFSEFACLVVAGVVANAAVCATLASSLDRFQARVVWLLPFLALSALAALAAAQARTLSSNPARATNPA